MTLYLVALEQIAEVLLISLFLCAEFLNPTLSRQSHLNRRGRLRPFFVTIEKLFSLNQPHSHNESPSL